ncbi:hypothetical protein [Ekhidna sp.]|uniref:hypothetical protein n=1 Tax=Ekhidna sp. TaxID=2608089 RepID=UPI003BA981A1
MYFETNLIYISMLSLGTFIGGLTNYGLNTISKGNDFVTVITSSIGLAFGGALFIFIQAFKLGEGKAIYMYPIGLVLSLIWGQINVTIENRIKGDNMNTRIIGYVHLIGVSALTVFLIFKLFFTEFIVS